MKLLWLMIKLTEFWGWVSLSFLIKWRWTCFKPNVGFTDSAGKEVVCW